MPDPMTETDEDKAALTAMRDEQPIELVQPELEPKPEAEPKPAEQAKPTEAKPVEPEPQKPVRLVPHQALHEERIRRQALEREMAELRKGQQQAPREQGEEIDENENPLGAIGQLKAKIKQYEDREAQAQQRFNEDREVVTRMHPRVAAYKAEHPEYDDQFAYVRQSRATELQLLGHSPEGIAQQLAAEEMALARQTLAHDLDPGEVIARLATARGWRAEEADPNPSPVPAKPAVDPKPAVEKIERIARGQKAATSSSSGGGGGGSASDEPSIEDLLELDGAAFDKAAANWIKTGKRAGA